MELVQTGKVLLFTADAQRGSWISWNDLAWDSGTSAQITARDLLGRTVLYKVGHHGSHNATLNGQAEDDHPNLGWMARGQFAEQFVAMIPSNETWARDRRPHPWKHPLKAIEEALIKKARGKVFQTNRDEVAKPENVGAGEWSKFTSRVSAKDMFFDYTIEDR